MKIFRNDQQAVCWDYIINMKNIKIKPDYEIISVYKNIIWQTVTKARCFVNEDKNLTTFLQDIEFYLTYIYCMFQNDYVLVCMFFPFYHQKLLQ